MLGPHYTATQGDDAPARNRKRKQGIEDFSPQRVNHVMSKYYTQYTQIIHTNFSCYCIGEVDSTGLWFDGATELENREAYDLDYAQSGIPSS